MVSRDKRVTPYEMKKRRRREEPSRLGEGKDEEDDEQEHLDAAEEPRRGNDWQRRTVVLRYQTVKVPENNG
ncbi:hypothetical protein ALC57_06752 [Trachymyrmex cornetzi]|uniref:Uncharacterized protein n=1 Tax=Trachymyrmex cornetzi TaxID=471704 RepID=A0A195E6X5_9HYME|nr:hypothetical protein ALC57_06752 [Trachymyrmex cornetzi]